MYKNVFVTLYSVRNKIFREMAYNGSQRVPMMSVCLEVWNEMWVNNEIIFIFDQSLDKYKWR